MSKRKVCITLAVLLAGTLVPASQANGDCFVQGSIACGVTIYDCDLFCKSTGTCQNYDVPAVNHMKPWAQPGSPGKVDSINTPGQYICTTYFYCEDSGSSCGSGGWLNECTNDDFNESRYQYEYGSQPNGAAC